MAHTTVSHPQTQAVPSVSVTIHEQARVDNMSRNVDTDEWADNELNSDHDVHSDEIWIGPLLTSRFPAVASGNSSAQASMFTSMHDSTAPSTEGYAVGLSARGRPFRKIRVPGGAVATPRKITADLDSEDELIMTLKEHGYSDQQVVNELRKQGRTKYNRKTINSRTVRIKLAIATRQDELLEQELTDWHEGEDEALLEAYALAVAYVNNEIEKLRNNRFVYAARYLQQLKPGVKYSGRACRKRYIALINEEATVPPELDDGPAKRAEDKAARALAKLAREQATEKAIEEEREREKRAEEQARREMAEKRKLWAEKRARQAEDKAAKEKAKAEAAKKRRLEKEAKDQEAADKVIRAKAREEALTRVAAAKADKEAAAKAKQEAAEKEKAAKLALIKARQEAAAGSKKAPLSSPAQASLGQSSVAPSPSSARGTPRSPGTSVPLQSSSPAISRTSPAWPSVIQDPRRDIPVPVPERASTSKKRCVLKSGNEPDILQRLAEDDRKKTKADLQAMLRERGLPVYGSKPELIHRLATADADSARGQKGEKSTPSHSTSATSPPTGDSTDASATPSYSNPAVSTTLTGEIPKRVRTAIVVRQNTPAQHAENILAISQAANPITDLECLQTMLQHVVAHSTEDKSGVVPPSGPANRNLSSTTVLSAQQQMDIVSATSPPEGAHRSTLRASDNGPRTPLAVLDDEGSTMTG